MVFDTNFKIDQDSTFKAQIPTMVKENDSFTWKLGEEQTISAGSNSMRKVHDTIPVSPHSHAVGEVQWAEGVIAGLPFTVTYNVVFNDDTSHDFKFDGF